MSTGNADDGGITRGRTVVWRTAPGYTIMKVYFLRLNVQEH